jgi:hypothetical protein
LRSSDLNVSHLQEGLPQVALNDFYGWRS